MAQAGNFTAAQLLEVVVKGEEMWKNSQYEASLIPNAEAAVAVLKNQTAQFKELDDYSEKNRKVKVTYIDACGGEVQDCEASCELDGEELSANSEIYEPNICKEHAFKIDVTKLRDTNYTSDELVLRGHARALKLLDEYWAQQILAKAKLNAGINLSPAPFIWDNVNNTTRIPDADYKLQMLANLVQQANMNRINAPYFIENGSLFVEMFNAEMNAGNLDGKGDASRLAMLKRMLYQDAWNFAPAGITESLFMIGSGALAFKTVNEYKPIPINLTPLKQAYSVKSNLLTGVSYDVEYSKTCKVVNNKERYFHTWRYRTNGLIEINPKGCPVNFGGNIVEPTGILSYTKGLNNQA